MTRIYFTYDGSKSRVSFLLVNGKLDIINMFILKFVILYFSRNIKQIKVFVKTFTNKILAFNVKKEDTVDSLKSHIAEVELIDKPHQRLFFNDVQMIDFHQLLMYKVENGSTILCQSSVLLAMEPSGDIFTFDISPDDTIINIKHKIKEKTDIPVADQRVFYSCCSFRGKRLHDSLTVAENKIGGNFVYVLRALSVPQIFVEILESSRIIINVPVNFKESIFNIKRKIQRQVLSNVKQYKLFLHDQELIDTQSLDYYNVKNEAVLQLCKDKMIFVKHLSEKKFEIQVNLSDTISVLKMKIQEKTGVLENMQNLFFHNVELTDFTKALAQYDIGFGMKLELKTGMKIFVTSPQKKTKMVFEMQKTDTIQSLKEAIRNKEGISEETNLCLILDNCELEDSWNNFKENLLLKLLTGSVRSSFVKIYVEQKSYLVRAKPSDQLITIVQSVENIIGKSINKNLLYDCENKCLKPTTKLSDTNIDSVLALYLTKSKKKLFKIFVKNLTGGCMTLLVTAKTLIDQVRQMIFVKEGVPVYDQRLIFDGIQLCDGCTVSDYKISALSVVHIVLRLRGC